MEAEEDQHPVARESKLWPAGGQPLSFFYVAVLLAVIQVPAVMIFVLLSVASDASYHVYHALAGLVRVGPAFLLAGTAGALLLHALNWYNWRSPVLRVLSMAVVAEVLVFGGLCYTLKYPGVPLILTSIHFPVIMGAMRAHTSGKLSSHGFYQGITISCAAAAFWVFLAWVVWLAASDLGWGEVTKARLHRNMRPIFDLYGVPGDWSSCVRERAKKGTRDLNLELLENCQLLEQMTFLIWGAPLAEACVLLGLAIVTSARAALLSPDSHDADSAGPSGAGAAAPPNLDRSLKVVLLSCACGLAGLWIGAQTMGASMGLSNLYLAALLVAGTVMVVWLANSFDLNVLTTHATNSILWKLAKPFLTSDWFYGFVLCFALGPAALALALEVLVRGFERLRCQPGRSPWITDRGLWLWELLARHHWASLLEKCFLLCMAYFVSFLFNKFTAVFFGWLNGTLVHLNFWAVVGIFYAIGLFLFMLPPMPGVPVYLAAGVIIANQGKTIMGLPGAIVFASLVATLQKVNGVVLVQVLVGRVFGKSQYVQQLVGIHTGQIRAIEKILIVPRLTLDKIYILCGGPDWPVAALTGILGLGVGGVALGTFPSVLLIAPCVIAGACLMDEQLSSMSGVITMIVGVTQGGLLLAALIASARQAERHHAELSIPKPEHAPLLKLAEEANQKSEDYKRKTAWSSLTVFQRLSLAGSVVLLQLACGFLTFFSSLCFRNFEIGNNIDSSLEDGGLNGNVLNVVKWPLGVGGVVAVGVGLVLHGAYQVMTVCMPMPAHADQT